MIVIYVLDIHLPKLKYEHFSMHKNPKMIKSNLIKKYNTVNKMEYLKNIYKNYPVIIFSCGPTSNIDFNNFKKIQNKYVIIAVKYISKTLINHGINVDFIICSDWCQNQGQIRHHPDIPIVNVHNTYNKNNYSNNNYDLNIYPLNNQTHTQTFEKIKNSQNIDDILYTSDKIKKNGIYPYLGHIMLEVAIPLAVFIGCTEIHTLGWDLDYHTYFDGSKVLIKNNLTETQYVKDIYRMFKKNGINLYKSNINSPIMLPYKNLT